MTNSDSWRPSATINTLKARAQLYRFIRDFFDSRNVLEVETPVISAFATVDPFIESLSTVVCDQVCYLQTSPEFFLKRLLASGSGDIYSLGKVFRQGEQGKKHNPEFTLLEWYRLGWDEYQLMDELRELICLLLPSISSQKISYRDLFIKHLNIDPHNIPFAEAAEIVREKITLDFDLPDKSTCLDLLMTHCIEPNMVDGLLFIYDYPATQAALAKLGKNPQGQVIARRFEVYLQGMELANGYFELTDAAEQKRRFESDISYRRAQGFTELPYDATLVAALHSGMPECAGVALGVDRLLMLLEAKANISQVISFTTSY